MSVRYNQGATFTAVNLGIYIERDYRHTTMIADTNLRYPSVHRYFDYNPEESGGMEELLSGKAILRDILVNHSINGIVFLPGRESISHYSELLMVPETQLSVKDLISTYKSRINIFDLPPILETDDALAFMDEFDAWLLVVEGGVTTESDIHEMSVLL